MGKTSRPYRPRYTPDNPYVRDRRNTRPSSIKREKLEIDTRGRFKRKYPAPSIGNGFGELTVVGNTGPRTALVQCSCGCPPYRVELSNLRRGKSTRCNNCAKKQTGYWRKNFWAYADIVSNDGHRRRLLNRISACINRCTNPNDKRFYNYGGRGIKVFPLWLEDRREFLGYIVTLKGWDNPKLELDRIKNDQGYEPGNLQFSTRRANNKNRRTIQQLQERILELEACLRSCQCGAVKTLHDPIR